MAEVILIVYTTRYRKGGSQFPIVARTLAGDRSASFDGEVLVRAVESKRDVLRALAEIRTSDRKIREFHFVGHSGMYGPMFGTVAFPEQFSPYEWENLDIPFAEGASAWFHCCRSARWFAPFFSRTFNVRAHGFFWYTTFSLSPTHYRYASPAAKTDRLYTIGCKGRHSHGVGASLLKFSGMMPAEEMKSFDPEPVQDESSYNRVAALYDETFADIRVRRDEWKWINEHLEGRTKIAILDIGCGNGALLRALSGRIAYGAGVDESEPVLERARAHSGRSSNLEFFRIDSPHLPFEDARFDMAISLMSFRYLDWDPLLREVKRVTRPGGVFLVLDMVTVPVKPSEYPRFVADKMRLLIQQKSDAVYDRNLRKLVSHPDWKTMLRYNPIRSEHEMKWYLESRFPGRRMEILNMGWNSRLVAFDSGPVERGVDAPLTYP